ncbi:MAG TPA: aldo/keto reductase [Polyangiaceae bacterium LLY-WYZ-15_(1-7)]|nr:2,5-diketo-D-gluconic acid reductase [Myxococcales bacterium]MAT25684.1 2,5-diketo-D-gluconic acid reductase [Sandaracinus sp.]HJK89128.1 aldo/keto reductase [Polyangiaceae bacterium LLY-WYZ-15_(1-7)]MBJ74255.1 2,5-diketo-D-gluconic acid reductase [Sandaracinus sp.]HJL00255.1 aldo/keto reductase [Polyangiaceae bacterium LLY-WYZ-15_(1-7)]
MILQETFTLANGVEIPKIGLGTWMISDDSVGEAVEAALALGYRHIDTAQAYENEAGVGRGVRASGLPREQLFVTTKLAAEVKSHDEAVSAIDGSLKALGLDVIDLMLIHSPQPWMEFAGEDRFFEGNREAWRALEEAYEAGKLRAIGVSNFQKVDLENLLGSCRVKPMVNQVLAHIGKTPTELIDFARAQGILTEAYSPIGHGVLLEHEAVGEMAAKYGVSIPQLSIRYALQLGLLPLPKTANPAHMKDNAGVDFTISDEDMEALKGLPEIDDYGEANVFPVYGGKLG